MSLYSLCHVLTTWQQARNFWGFSPLRVAVKASLVPSKGHNRPCFTHLLQYMGYRNTWVSVAYVSDSCSFEKGTYNLWIWDEPLIEYHRHLQVIWKSDTSFLYWPNDPSLVYLPVLHYRPYILKGLSEPIENFIDLRIIKVLVWWQGDLSSPIFVNRTIHDVPGVVFIISTLCGDTWPEEQICSNVYDIFLCCSNTRTYASDYVETIVLALCRSPENTHMCIQYAKPHTLALPLRQSGWHCSALPYVPDPWEVSFRFNIHTTAWKCNSWSLGFWRFFHQQTGGDFHQALCIYSVEMVKNSWYDAIILWPWVGSTKNQGSLTRVPIRLWCSKKEAVSSGWSVHKHPSKNPVWLVYKDEGLEDMTPQQLRAEIMDPSCRGPFFLVSPTVLSQHEKQWGVPVNQSFFPHDYVYWIE